MSVWMWFYICGALGLLHGQYRKTTIKRALVLSMVWPAILCWLIVNWIEDCEWLD